ncbi:MAG: response regulator [Lachnospiraceae bacterium]|jgi:YesN/AraC family two-component response regulator|nr:response regulator [Lachnospiraceae bacterium]
MNILLVDDEVVALRALERRVNWGKYGFTQVFTALNAEEARKILSRKMIDFVMCDIEMPGESGIDLVRDIKENFPETECMMVTCHADFGYMQQSVRNHVLDYILKPIDYEELDGILQKFIDTKNETQLQNRLRSITKKTEESLGTEPAGETDNAVGTVKKYIADHLQEKIRAEDLAELVHMNDQYLMRLFKKETGMSITEYLTDQRMEVAAGLLRKTDRSINFIASCTGCEDSSYFTKLFKKYAGCTPKEYRAVYQK